MGKCKESLEKEFYIQMTKPDNMKELLPTPEEIAKRLKIFDNDN